MTFGAFTGVTLRSIAALLFASTLGATAASAAVTISGRATRNMTCSAGVCTPTAAKANLNITDLANMLAAHDTKVVADSAANDIEFKAPLSWTSTSRLTLDSYRSIAFQQPISVTGTGALTITTNDGGSGGDYYLEGAGRIAFWDASSNLIIDGSSYTLITTVEQLANAVSQNPSGFYALASNYDAASDGTYSQSPMATSFAGIFAGLGNAIADLRVHSRVPNSNVGLFAFTGSGSIVRNLYMDHCKVSGANATDGQTETVGSVAGYNSGALMDVHARCIEVSGLAGAFVGGLAGFNAGLITHSSAKGTVSGAGQAAVGGLSGSSSVSGFIGQSHADGTVNGGGGYYAGGLIGDNRNSGIEQSYATGSVSGASIYNGGLAGSNEGAIDNSYATGSVTGGAATFDGGLVGSTDGTVARSYSVGAVTAGGATDVGGFAGNNLGAFDDNYWDVDTSGFGKHKGCGDSPDCNGLTGLTTTQFQHTLPIGFDPAVWGQKKNVNNGYPYLLGNKPLK